MTPMLWREEVGSRMGEGYRDVDAAVDWIVVSGHWLGLVQLPGGSIIPPGEGGGCSGPLSLAPPLLTPPPSSPSHIHMVSRCPHHPWAPTHHGPALGPVTPTSSPGSPGHCCLYRRVRLSSAQCQSD